MRGCRDAQCVLPADFQSPFFSDSCRARRRRRTARCERVVVARGVRGARFREHATRLTRNERTLENALDQPGHASDRRRPPIGIWPGRASFLTRDRCLFWVVGCPTAGRGFGEASTSIGPFAPAAGSGPRLHRSCGVSHPRATPREAVACLTRRPPLTRLVRNSGDLKRDARDWLETRFSFFFSEASANFLPRRLLTAAFLAPSRQSTASWRRRARGRFPRF